jgi:UDP-N-acetylglucosamine 2-epimerase (non-hydrolysing)
MIKLAPLIRKIQNLKQRLHVVHTGQHYDYLMAGRIMEDLELGSPDVSFELQSNSPSLQIAQMISELNSILNTNADDIVIVQGDTNTVLAGALAAIKNRKRISHIEAGLRSHDWRMPEEHNRRIVDHLSDYLFAPTKESESNLKMEHVPGKVFVTGNTVIDAVNEHMPVALRKSKVQAELKFADYVLATLHRAENVDDKKILTSICKGMIASRIPIIMPLHPRTKRRLKEFGIFDLVKSASNIELLSPKGYFDFLILMKNSTFILTDSGGIQEEATAKSILKRVLVLRLTTERTEAVQAGFAELIPLDQSTISAKIKSEWNSNHPKLSRVKSPYGDGHASQKILDTLQLL